MFENVACTVFVPLGRVEHGLDGHADHDGETTCISVTGACRMAPSRAAHATAASDSGEPSTATRMLAPVVRADIARIPFRSLMMVVIPVRRY